MYEAGGSRNGGTGGSFGTGGSLGASSGTGGSTGVGGSVGTGGSIGVGGSVTTGGSGGTGASVGTGGSISINVGGSPGTGATGGTAATGGSLPTGGSAGAHVGGSGGRGATGATGGGGNNVDSAGAAGAFDEGPGLRLAGVAQKGAFERGSSVVALELDAMLVQTGRTFATQVTADTGQYAVNVNSTEGSYVQLTANGFYYDEVTDDDSAAPLQLVALSHLRDRSIVNINVLTDLEAPRVEYLVSRGEAFDDAKAQAQAEVLAAFEITLPALPPSEALDETGSSEGDAALLAVSTLVQGYFSVSEVSALLSVIAQDLRADGTLDDADAGAQLMNSAALVSPALVRQRLTARYAALGHTVALGEFETYVQNFRSVAPYPLVSRIKFPDQGTYGSNVMALSGAIATGDYSLVAHTPAKEPVRMRMTWTGDPSMAGVWYYSDYVNFSPTNFDFSTGVQDFTVVDPGSPSDLHLVFSTRGAGSARIDAYEGDAAALTLSRDISWNQ